MPVYTCTTTTSTLTADIKGALAKEISRIHAEINHVPTTYVNVVFHELPPVGSTPTVYPRIRCSSTAGCDPVTQQTKPPVSQRKSRPRCLGSPMFLPTG
jgi:phenylpyruvate tautomerase PptA (4-oxalocrotonate tautomerase family)